MPEQVDAMAKVVKFVQELTGGLPAAVADVAEALKKNNFPELKTKLEEMDFPFANNLYEKRKWWGENWKTVRHYSIDELKNDSLEDPDKPRR